MRKTPDKEKKQKKDPSQQPEQSTLKPEAGQPKQPEQKTLSVAEQAYFDEQFGKLEKKLFDAVKAAKYEGHALLEKKVDGIVAKVDKALTALEGYPGAVAQLSQDMENLRKVVVDFLANAKTPAPQSQPAAKPAVQPIAKQQAVEKAAPEVLNSLPASLRDLVIVAVVKGKDAIKPKAYIKPKGDWNAINSIVKGYGYRWNKDAGAWL